jgi:molybdate transport system regulatory protein
MSNRNNKYQLKGRIWIEIGGQTFIGEGKALLLKKTTELGSLLRASAELKMSYRQAWYRMNRMNRATKNPVMILHRGGKHGGIAQITEFGEVILNMFERSQHEFERFLKKQTLILNRHT